MNGKIILIIALVVLVTLIMITSSNAHGWYPNYCCHEGDCIHARDGDVSTNEYGFVVHAGATNNKGQTLVSDHIVPWGDKRIKGFPPEAYDPKWGKNNGGIHICIFRTQLGNEGVRCIFADPRT